MVTRLKIASLSVKEDVVDMTLEQRIDGFISSIVRSAGERTFKMNEQKQIDFYVPEGMSRSKVAEEILRQIKDQFYPNAHLAEGTSLGVVILLD